MTTFSCPLSLRSIRHKVWHSCRRWRGMSAQKSRFSAVLFHAGISKQQLWMTMLLHQSAWFPCSTWGATSRHYLAGLPIPTYLWRAAQPQPDRLPAWRHRRGHAASSLRESPGPAAAGRLTPSRWRPQTAVEWQQFILAMTYSHP